MGMLTMKVMSRSEPTTPETKHADIRGSWYVGVTSIGAQFASNLLPPEALV